MMSRFTEILRTTRSDLSRIARTWQGKAGLGVIAFAILTISAFLNPIRESDSPKALRKSIFYDQGITIPRIPGGASSMRPQAEDAAVAGGTGSTDDELGV